MSYTNEKEIAQRWVSEFKDPLWDMPVIRKEWITVVQHCLDCLVCKPYVYELKTDGVYLNIANKEQEGMWAKIKASREYQILFLPLHDKLQIYMFSGTPKSGQNLVQNKQVYFFTPTNTDFRSVFVGVYDWDLKRFSGNPILDLVKILAPVIL
jgi:hypothetical protein